MPEVILPCPACGSRECESVVCTISADEHQSLHFNVECDGCYTSGPVLDREAAAIAAWNAMPRALTWTHEPPKVAGIYLIRSMLDGEQQGSIGAITVKMPFDYDKSHFIQYAGPIAPPID